MLQIALVRVRVCASLLKYFPLSSSPSSYGKSLVSARASDSWSPTIFSRISYSDEKEKRRDARDSYIRMPIEVTGLIPRKYGRFVAINFDTGDLWKAGLLTAANYDVCAEEN